MDEPSLPSDIIDVVARALAEDVGPGDLTATLIQPHAVARAQVVANEPATLCGTAWVDEVFRQVDSAVSVDWRAADGGELAASTVVCELNGPARSIVTGERTALNFLQTLSGTATATRRFVAALAGTRTRLLDTRKTLPGLRQAQKYAVRCGGGGNHRMGLYDAVLIKENHIAAVGGVGDAVRTAKRDAPNVLIEVEVETLAELKEALATATDRIMLDDLPIAALRDAVALRDAHAGKRKELEVSGGVSLENIAAIAATGVDFVSIGAITKHVRAIDFSLRFV
jgi:nicotinate-nucleotide pyrophosphorylase (carboxylating)